MPYIYVITNDINNKKYVGKTSLTIKERFAEHLRDCRKTTEEKRPLYDAINKYGAEHFHIEEIEKTIDDITASERENYYINKLRTYVGFDDCQGYNATYGGDGKRLYDYKQLAEAYKKLGTVKAVTEEFKCDEQTVRSACKEYEIEIKIAPNQKKIRRIDKNNNYKDYNSVTEAAKDIPNKVLETARKNISRGLNKKTTAYGYSWQLI